MQIVIAKKLSAKQRINNTIFAYEMSFERVEQCHLVEIIRNIPKYLNDIGYENSPHRLPCARCQDVIIIYKRFVSLNRNVYQRLGK